MLSEDSVTPSKALGGNGKGKEQEWDERERETKADHKISKYVVKNREGNYMNLKIHILSQVMKKSKRSPSNELDRGMLELNLC